MAVSSQLSAVSGYFLPFLVGAEVSALLMVAFSPQAGHFPGLQRVSIL
jgi:hypothetical protein